MGMKGGLFHYRTKRGERWGFKTCVNYRQIKRMGYQSKDKANAALLNLRGEKGLETKKYTFKMVTGAFMDQQTTMVKKTTLNHYRQLLSRHFKDFPQKPIADITFGDLYAWFYALNASIDTRERLLLLLKKIFEHAEVYFGVRNIEYKKLVIPKDYSIKEVKEKNVLTQEEFEKFYKGLTGGLFWQTLFLTAFVCGLRVGEVRGIQVKCLDLEKGILHIIQEASTAVGEGKTILLPPKSKASNRDYYLPDFLIEKIRKLVEERKLSGDDFLFHGLTQDKPPRPNPKAFIWTMTIYREMDKAQKAAGLKHFNFHYFRHS